MRAKGNSNGKVNTLDAQKTNPESPTPRPKPRLTLGPPRIPRPR
jgi:hypothetical protein